LAEPGRTFGRVAEAYDRTRPAYGGAVLDRAASLLELGPDAKVVDLAAGTGKLTSALGMRFARVIAVEPELSCALHASLDAGRSVTVEPRSAADGLNGPYAGPNCVAVCSELGVESVLVTEQELADAFRFVYGRMKLACELAGAATAAALLAGKVDVEPGRTIAAVVSGGNVAPKSAAAILAGP
jgi:threonine dehydratase